MMNKILIFMIIIRIIMLFLAIPIIYKNIKSDKFNAKYKKDLIIHNISDLIIVLLFTEVIIILILHEKTKNIFEKIGCYLDKISYKIYKFLKKVIK